MAIIQVETWLSDVNDFVTEEADDMSYSVRIAALNLIMVSSPGYHGYPGHVTCDENYCVYY